MVNNRFRRKEAVITENVDITAEINRLFPGEEEARRYFKFHKPWSYGELRAIRAFEFHFQERDEEYKILGPYRLWVQFYSFGKLLPFMIEVGLDNKKSICGLTLHRPTYLYPDCDSGLVEELQKAGITLSDSDEVSIYGSNLDCSDLGDSKVVDTLKIIQELLSNSINFSQALETPPPRKNFDPSMPDF